MSCNSAQSARPANLPGRAPLEILPHKRRGALSSFAGFACTAVGFARPGGRGAGNPQAVRTERVLRTPPRAGLSASNTVRIASRTWARSQLCALSVS